MFVNPVSQLTETKLK